MGNICCGKPNKSGSDKKIINSSADNKNQQRELVQLLKEESRKEAFISKGNLIKVSEYVLTKAIENYQKDK